MQRLLLAFAALLLMAPAPIPNSERRQARIGGDNSPAPAEPAKDFDRELALLGGGIFAVAGGVLVWRRRRS